MIGYLRLLPGFCALAFAVACGFIDPSMLARLSALDPMSADPGDMVARVSLPDGLDVAPNGAVLEFSARRSDSEEQVAGWYPLQRSGEFWRLSAEDAAAIRDIQSQLRMWENEAPSVAEGRFEMHVKGCAVGDGPDPDAPVTVDLSLDGGSSFRPFLKNVSASEIMRATGGGGTLEPCESS